MILDEYASQMKHLWKDCSKTQGKKILGSAKLWGQLGQCKKTRNIFIPIQNANVNVTKKLKVFD